MAGELWWGAEEDRERMDLRMMGDFEMDEGKEWVEEELQWVWDEDG